MCFYIKQVICQLKMRTSWRDVFRTVGDVNILVMCVLSLGAVYMYLQYILQLYWINTACSVKCCKFSKSREYSCNPLLDMTKLKQYKCRIPCTLQYTVYCMGSTALRSGMLAWGVGQDTHTQTPTQFAILSLAGSQNLCQTIRCCTRSSMTY